VDVTKPGQEKTLNFSSYQWPWCGTTPGPYTPGGTMGTFAPLFHGTTQIIPWVDPTEANHAIKVCANAKNEIKEGNSANNCITKLWGMLLDVDLIPSAHLAAWRNGSGVIDQYAQENSPSGAYIKLSDGSLEMVPQQVSQGWIAGYWGAFYTRSDTGSAEVAAVKLPAKTHLVARVGLSPNAQGSDGVTFKVGLKDLSDVTNYLPGKKMTTPGVFEDWDVDLSSYEGQTVYFILRVEAGNSPANDYAIWKVARLVQISD